MAFGYPLSQLQTVQVYVENLIAVKTKHQELKLLITVRKRRDLEPLSNTAGDYIVNRMDANDETKCQHFQTIPLPKVNQILTFNRKPLLSPSFINQAYRQHATIIGPYDNIAFAVHADADLTHQGYLEQTTYRMDWSTVDNPKQFIDYRQVESLWELRASKTTAQLNALRQSYWSSEYPYGPRDAKQVKMSPDFKSGQYLSQTDFLILLAKKGLL